MIHSFYSVGVYGRPSDADSRPRAGQEASSRTEGATNITPSYDRSYPPQTLDEFEDALYAVAGNGGLPSTPALLGGEELGLRVSVEAESPAEALLRVMDFYKRAAIRAYGAAPVIDEIEAVEQGKFEVREGGAHAGQRGSSASTSGEPQADDDDDLIGKSAAARILGVAPQRVDYIERQRAAGSRDDFPEPVRRTDKGRTLWRREDIEAFDRGWRRKRTGRPQRPVSSG